MSEPPDSLTIPPKDFGDGWMSKSAQGMCELVKHGFQTGSVKYVLTDPKQATSCVLYESGSQAQGAQNALDL